jgi:hypothetical protein
LEMGLRTICPGLPQTWRLKSSASQVAGITGVSHQHPAVCLFFLCSIEKNFQGNRKAEKVSLLFCSETKGPLSNKMLGII